METMETPICRRCRSLLAELPAHRARSSSPLRSRRLSEPAPLLPHNWRKEEHLELSPLRSRASLKQEEAKEFLVQGQSSPTYQDQTPIPLFPLQGAGIDVDLQAGMFRKMPMLELATELLGLLSINLVLAPGVVFAGLKKWLLAMLVAKALARL
jgi:hypothetical protein